MFQKVTFRPCYGNLFLKVWLTFLWIDYQSILKFWRFWWHVYENGFQKVTFRPCYGDLFLKVWRNISANQFEMDSKILKKFDGMFTKRCSKRWSFAPGMETSFWRSDVTFLRFDSKWILKFWRNLMACLRKEKSDEPRWNSTRMANET